MSVFKRLVTDNIYLRDLFLRMRSSPHRSKRPRRGVVRSEFPYVLYYYISAACRDADVATQQWFLEP